MHTLLPCPQDSQKSPRSSIFSTLCQSPPLKKFECMRRLRNTKVELREECRNKHLNNFMVKSKHSGIVRNIEMKYSEGFEKMLLDDKMNVIPLFRPRGLIWEKGKPKKNKHESSRSCREPCKGICYHIELCKGICYHIEPCVVASLLII